MGVERIDTLATEAVRQASNGPDLVAEIARQTGLSARILSGEEEAYYGALGVVSGFYRPAGLTGDMGGGSLEMADVLDDSVGLNRISLTLGALPVRHMLEDGVAAAKARVDTLLRDGIPQGIPARHSMPSAAAGAPSRGCIWHRHAPVRVVHGYALAAADARGV